MATVSETELEQKTSEYISFVRDFSLKLEKDYTFKGKSKEFALSIFDKDVTLDFSL